MGEPVHWPTTSYTGAEKLVGSFSRHIQVLREVAVEKAVALSAEKYCSASIMLEKGGVEITQSFEVENVE